MFDKDVKNTVNDLVKHERELFLSLKNRKILITGATGLIGRQIILCLLEANKQLETAIEITALVRSLEKARNLFVEEDKDINFVVGDITETLSIISDIDYIIHGASVTDSLDFVKNPTQTIMTAVQGTKNILELAKQKDVKGAIFLSSLEVYGSFSERQEVTETDFGYLDPCHVRSSYSESKRLAESLCTAYASQYQLPIKIARLSQTFGPGVSYDDNRVFAQFARAAIEGKDIVLHTEGKTERNYCAISDAISGIFYILLKGESGEAYNVANESTMISIIDMAYLVSKVSQHDIAVVVQQQDITKFGYNSEVKIKLLTSKLENLGWSPKVDLNMMLKSLISSMMNGKYHE